VGKGGRCVGLTTLPPSCAIVLKSGSLNLLEPSGPVQVCNGIALPLHAYKFFFVLCMQFLGILYNNSITHLQGHQLIFRDRDSTVGISTRYGLDSPEIESRCSEIFHTHSDQPWGPPSLLYNGYWVFPGIKATGAWH
jgi:hypothetical protein